MPLDWTYITSDKPIWYLSEGFKDKFKNFLLKENLEKLPQENISEFHSDKVGYYDKYTDYYFVNHFNKDIDLYPEEYCRVSNKIKTRLDRFYSRVSKSKNVLFILSINFGMDYASIFKLRETLKELFPNNNYDFIIMQFNAKENAERNENGIIIKSILRDYSLSDFIRSSTEFDYLDELELNEPFKSLLDIKKVKKGFCINIFKKINTIFYAKLYLLGVRVFFIVGKNRE